MPNYHLVNNAINIYIIDHIKHLKRNVTINYLAVQQKYLH